MAAWLYILYSDSLDRFYVGSTRQGVEERLEQHLAKHRHFTSKAKDWQIVYREEYKTKEEAYRREREIKAWKSRIRIMKLIASY